MVQFGLAIIESFVLENQLYEPIVYPDALVHLAILKMSVCFVIDLDRGWLVSLTRPLLLQALDFLQLHQAFGRPWCPLCRLLYRRKLSLPRAALASADQTAAEAAALQLADVLLTDPCILEHLLDLLASDGSLVPFQDDKDVLGKLAQNALDALRDADVFAEQQEFEQARVFDADDGGQVRGGLGGLG